MKSSSKNRIFAGAFASLFALVLMPGCGYSGANLCDDKCECSGCSDIDYDNCVDDADDLERDVEFQGCEDQYAEYMHCISSEFRCVQSKVDTDGCKNQNESLKNCLK